MQVHRHCDSVAIHLKDGSTNYLSTEVASELADAIVRVIDDIELNTFTESECGTWNSVNAE